jgi:hypothetical protein
VKSEKQNKVTRIDNEIKVGNLFFVPTPDDNTMLFELQSLLDFEKTFNDDNELELYYSKYIDLLKRIISDEEVRVILYNVSQVKSRLELIKKVKEEKISISIFKDKYSNEYFKAKMGMPEIYYENGKLKSKSKSFSVHIGSVKKMGTFVVTDEVREIGRKKLFQKFVEYQNNRFIKK